MNEPTSESPVEYEELTPLIIEPTVRIPAVGSGGPVWWIEPSNPEIDPSATPPPDGEP